MSDDRRSDGDDLDRRIAAAKQVHRLDPASSEATRADNSGMAVGIEFVGAVLVGAFVGWAADRWLGTKPWLMILFLVLGFATGLRRAMLMARAPVSAPGNTTK